jgi:hypothetical protein
VVPESTSPTNPPAREARTVARATAHTQEDTLNRQKAFGD